MYDLCKEDLRINFHTMRTGIFYGSTTGMTESLAAKIAARTGVAQTDVHNVADASADEAEGYDLLLLGSSTWGCGELQDDGSVETIDDQSEQDGAVVISTTTTYNDMPDYYFTTLYYIDPATGELLAKSVTDYSKDESGEASVLGTTLYDWSYGESYLPDKELAAEAFNSDEVCALTLVYNPGAADEETQGISIKRGTYVTFVSSTGNLLYADAALTQPIDDTLPIDTNGEEMTVYVVPDVPLN